MASDPVISKLKPAELQEIIAAFHAFDENHNGFITSQEMRECLRRSEIPYKNSEVDQAISTMDSNHDGSVSFDEYMKFMAYVYSGQIRQFQFGQSSKSEQHPKKK